MLQTILVQGLQRISCVIWRVYIDALDLPRKVGGQGLQGVGARQEVIARCSMARRPDEGDSHAGPAITGPQARALAVGAGGGRRAGHRGRSSYEETEAASSTGIR